VGYTSYWKMTEPVKLAPLQKKMIQEVLKENKALLFGADGTGKPVFNDKEILLNGNAKTDEDHETFGVEFGIKKDFDFCKTARKPYDLAVCKILLVLTLSKGFNISSDGTNQNDADETYLGDESWPEALAWFAKKGFQDTIDKKINPYLNDSRND
jgi:hypothetical protein